MKNKQIDYISKIMPKRQGIFTENFTSIFQMQTKLKKCRNLNLINSRRPSFEDGVDATFTS